ncbi:MAG: 4Fe-4S dicluster domain-containing protein [Ruminococcus sp.]|jgi:Na+-translocating ferredoxin:NAD+ oxidoreductase RNF subunit RnfB|nr:4Fe-4S dicluster domain-containing protein [Ruminococcus sp.]
MELITVEKEKCVGCNVCIRACPSRDANRVVVSDDGRYVTEVDHDSCVMCGECIKNCVHGARSYIDDTEKFLHDMQNAAKLVVIVSPACKTALPEMWQGLLDWLRSQGIVGIYDGSYGADISVWANARFVETVKNNKGLVTANCPSLIDYIEKYNHLMLDNLMPVWSPEVCTAIYLKEYLHVPYDIALLSPCIAKKIECLESEVINYNVTIKRLYDYAIAEKAKMRPTSASEVLYRFDGEQGIMGSMTCRAGGFRDALYIHDDTKNIVSSDGAKVYKALDLYVEMPSYKHPEIFDVFSCYSGCNAGPGTGFNDDMFEIMNVMRDIEANAKARRVVSTSVFGNKKPVDAQRKTFDETLDYKKFLREFKKQRRPSLTPTASELDEVFESMGKHTELERNFNCHSCGYDNCKEMATAVLRGLNMRENCIIYAKNQLSGENAVLEDKLDQINAVSENVSNFAEKLMADIESIYAALEGIEKNHDESDKYVNIIIGILTKIIDMCRASTSIEKQDLPTLINTLATLQNALSKLRESFVTSVTNSHEIRSSMKLVADAAVSLNSRVDDLLISLH